MLISWLIKEMAAQVFSQQGVSYWSCLFHLFTLFPWFSKRFVFVFYCFYYFHYIIIIMKSVIMIIVDINNFWKKDPLVSRNGEISKGHEGPMNWILGSRTLLEPSMCSNYNCSGQYMYLSVNCNKFTWGQTLWLINCD